MRRTIAALVAVVVGALALAVPTLAAEGPKDKENDTHVQLLAINDFHGHLAPNTPGTIQVGCCNPVLNTAGVQTGWTQKTVPAGGIEYLSTLIKSLRVANSNTITVGAGDLIGASPLVSGLFHDEPSIEALSQLGLDVSGVGNHEFDEGLAELLRMQFGGCHPTDGCQDGTPFFGAAFKYLAANVVHEGTDNTILPAYEVRKIDNAKIAFIGLTLEGTPLIVTPAGVAGLEFRPEIQTVNALVTKLRNEQGVRAFVVLLHQGGFQSTPAPVFPGPADQPNAFTDVNKCVGFNGPELQAIVDGLSDQVDVVVSAHTHAPYICEFGGKLVTSASSFGRLVTDIDLVIDHQTKDVKSWTAQNRIVTQDVAKDAAMTTILDKYRTLAAPLANREVGTITADIRSQRNPGGEQTAAGESALGDLVADSQLEATSDPEFGGAVIAFMNPGGLRGHLLFDNNSSGLATELPGDLTYEELFTVQPFGNSLVVKTMTGQMIHDLLEQQFSAASATTRTILQVSSGFTYSWYTNAAGAHVRVNGKVVVPGSIKLNSVAIPADATEYRVEMNSFLATGGDGFSVFNQGFDQLGGAIDLDALEAYLAAHSPVSPGPRDRITTTPAP
jgi:5'-nucleotidase